MPRKSTPATEPRTGPRRRTTVDATRARTTLIETRTSLNLTQEEVARRISMGQSNYSKIEVGLWDITVETATDITDVLWEEMKAKGIQRSHRDLFADLWLDRIKRGPRLANRGNA